MGAAAGAENGTIDPDLQAVIDAWKTLPESTKATIMAMVRIEDGQESRSTDNADVDNNL